MSKTKKFEINSNEPRGTTFEDVPESHWAGAHNKKPKANFGIMHGDPNGDTFVKNSSHIDMPKADKAPLISKAIYTSAGQGMYSPPKNDVKSGDSYAGRPGIGKSSPKKGRTDRIAQSFK